MDKKILVVIAHGTEDMEAVIIIDMLRRAGLTVQVAGENEIVTCSRGIKILPDILIESIDDYDEFDAIILPGGLAGTQRLSNNEYFQKILTNHYEQGKLIGAICAAPTILDDFKLISLDFAVTSHPSVKDLLANYKYTEENVVEDRNIITSRAAGTAFEFCLVLIERLTDYQTAVKVANDILLK